MKKIAIFLTALFAVSLLSGCISAPPGLERDKSAIQDLKKIKTEDYDCRCKKVRLGGKVAAATALKDKTRIAGVNVFRQTCYRRADQRTFYCLFEGIRRS